MSIYTKLYNVKKAWIKLIRDTKAFNYKYATLDQIQSKLWDILEQEKLLVLHKIIENSVITEIRDIESDDFISSSIELTTIKAQDKWSEITYYRRYNLLALLDLEVEDDDWKQAQDSYSKTELQRIKDENINKLKDLKEKGTEITLAQVRLKYKVSKESAEKLKELWII